MTRAALRVAGAVLVATIVAAGPGTVDPRLRVDQFGYLPAAVKVAVVAEPQIGFDAPDPYTPPTDLEIRRFGDDTVAWAGPVVAWNGGATHGQSGDRVWWLDFSTLTEAGEFYVFDPTADIGSHRFAIGADVWDEAQRHALRSFYYQRCGTPKAEPHAAAAWADVACHGATEQDLDCRPALTTST